MRLSKLPMAALAALSMASTPVLAQASTSASKPVSTTSASARTGADLQAANKSRGGSWLLGAGVIALVVVGILVLADGDNDPASP